MLERLCEFLALDLAPVPNPPPRVTTLPYKADWRAAPSAPAVNVVELSKERTMEDGNQ